MKEACKFADWISWYGYEQAVDTGKYEDEYDKITGI